MRTTLKRSLASIDERWPAVKYCSLGFYSAWILLTMRAGFVGSVLDGMDGDVSNWLYLYSGVPLTVILLLCGIFSLGISYNTAKGHVRKLYEKCGVHSRQELIDSLDASGESPRPSA